jgi:hypothetical protein
VELRRELEGINRELAMKSKLCAALFVFYIKHQDKINFLNQDMTHSQKVLDELVQEYKLKLYSADI